MSESDIENKKADALRVLRDFSQVSIDTLHNDDRQTLLEAILGVPAAKKRLAPGKGRPKQQQQQQDDDAEVVTPRDVRRKLEEGEEGEEAAEKECPGAPVARRRMMRVPRNVVNLFPGEDDVGVAN